jgi:hypothetical protein
MDSEVLDTASLLWVDLIVSHHKTSDTLRLALYKIIKIEIGKTMNRKLCPTLNYLAGSNTRNRIIYLDIK